MLLASSATLSAYLLNSIHPLLINNIAEISIEVYFRAKWTPMLCRELPRNALRAWKAVPPLTSKMFFTNCPVQNRLSSSALISDLRLRIKEKSPWLHNAGSHSTVGTYFGSALKHRIQMLYYWGQYESRFSTARVQDLMVWVMSYTSSSMESLHPICLNCITELWRMELSQHHWSHYYFNPQKR